MTVLRFNPDEMSKAGLAFVAAGDDLAIGASVLRGLAVPPMPATLAAQITEQVQSVASRLASVSSGYAHVGEQLQIRAEAARAADTASGAGSRAGHKLARAVTTSVEIVGAGGSAVLASITVGAGRVTATSEGGATMSASVGELGVAPQPAVTMGPASQQDTSQGLSTNADAPAPADAPPPASTGSPQGGLAATTVRDAVTVRPEDGLVDPMHTPGQHDAGHLRAVEHDGNGGIPAQHPMPAHHDTDRQDWACWMAGNAAHHGLPPSLPLMVALARSGLHNMPADGGGIGFFGIDPSKSFAPAGHGLPRDSQPDASWWADQPGAQLDHVIRKLRDAGGGVREANLDDGDALGRWAADAGLGHDPAQFAETQDAANAMLSHCRESGGPSVPAGHALAAARAQLGVHEVGVNAGAQVDRYLSAAHAGSGNPWCASFVTWSLEQSGHQMPGDGWASVSHWVGSASAGDHGLSLVDAAHARPGDIVAYDWGGGTDFGQDGHIGFLDSHVQDGRFTAVEGNAGDAVSRMQRSVGDGNVVFIRAHA